MPFSASSWDLIVWCYFLPFPFLASSSLFQSPIALGLSYACVVIALDDWSADIYTHNIYIIVIPTLHSSGDLGYIFSYYGTSIRGCLFHYCWLGPDAYFVLVFAQLITCVIFVLLPLVRFIFLSLFYYIMSSLLLVLVLFFLLEFVHWLRFLGGMQCSQFQMRVLKHSR